MNRLLKLIDIDYDLTKHEVIVTVSLFGFKFSLRISLADILNIVLRRAGSRHVSNVVAQYKDSNGTVGDTA